MNNLSVKRINNPNQSIWLGYKVFTLKSRDRYSGWEFFLNKFFDENLFKNKTNKKIFLLFNFDRKNLTNL